MPAERQISGACQQERAAEEADAALGPDRCTQRQQRPQHGAQQPSAVERVEGEQVIGQQAEIDQRKARQRAREGQQQGQIHRRPGRGGEQLVPVAQRPRPQHRALQAEAETMYRLPQPEQHGQMPGLMQRGRADEGEEGPGGVEIEPRAQQRDEPRLNPERKLQGFHRTPPRPLRGCRRPTACRAGRKRRG